MLTVTVISLYSALIPKDSAQNTKMLTTITVFSFASAIAAYGLALWHFSSNPQYMMQFMLAVMMLILLPSALISVSISTVTISNLRDTLGATQSK